MVDEQNYVIDRIYNNNVLLVREPLANQEIMLLGKGLGFGQKIGNLLATNDQRIEKKFRLEQEHHIRQYEMMIHQVDHAVIGIAEEIIALITTEISPNINEHVHVALPDHIQFAIHRLKNGLEIINPFLIEIQTLFGKEYSLAERASKMIEEQFEIVVPESEIGFLALHIHSAISDIPVAETVQFANLITDLVTEIEQSSKVSIKRQSLEYARLIMHLRCVIERIRGGNTSANPLQDQIRATLPDAYQLASELGTMISQRLEIAVPDDETGYIALHLHRLLQQLESKWDHPTKACY